jgi:hypothetical protein
MLGNCNFELLIPDFLKRTNSLFVAVLDLEGKVWFAGQHFMDAFGVSSSEAMENAFLNSLQKSAKEGFFDHIHFVLASPHQVFQKTIQHQRFVAQWDFSMLKNQEGDFSGILAVGFPEKTSHAEFQTAYLDVINPRQDLVIRLNSNWEITFANGVMSYFFESGLESILDKSIWQTFKHPKIYQYALEFKHSKENSCVRTWEDYLHDLGKWFKIHVVPLENGIEVVFKDISESKILNNELKQAYLTLQSVIEHADESIILMGRDLRILNFNEKATKMIYRLFGKEIQVGEKFTEYLMPEWGNRFLNDIQKVYGGKAVTYEYCLANTLQRHYFYPLINPAGDNIGLAYTCKEKLQDLHAETKLSEVKNLFQEQAQKLHSTIASILGLLEMQDSGQPNTIKSKHSEHLRKAVQELDKTFRDQQFRQEQLMR